MFSFLFSSRNFLLYFFLPRSMWDLSSQTRDQIRPPAMEARSFNHWATREVPVMQLLEWKAMLFSIQPLFHFPLKPSPLSHAQKGKPYPIYLLPGQGRQHEVCHHPLHHSYAGSTKRVLHSESKQTPPQGRSAQSLRPREGLDEDKCVRVINQENCPCRWGQGIHKMAQNDRQAAIDSFTDALLTEGPALLQTLWMQRQVMINSALRELTVLQERDIETNQEETDRCQGKGEHGCHGITQDRHSTKSTRGAKYSSHN